MPVTTKEISTYSVSAISDAEPNNLAATVRLFDAGGKGIAFLRFYTPGSSLARNEFRADLGYPLVSYPSTALAAVVDVLRNERPLYFIWYDYMPVRCFGAVATSREAVGESEGA
jgi:hypothetical protein